MSTYPHPYPGVELALKRTNGDRAAARHLIRAHILADADRRAELANRSMKCQRGEHATERSGCANDGSGCLCGCHDVPGPYTEQETTNG